MKLIIADSAIAPPCENGSAIGRRPFAHEEAMDALIGRDSKAIALDIGLAARTVRAWTEDARVEDHEAGVSSGGIGPGRLLSQAIRASRDLGRPWPVALEPLLAILRERLPEAAAASPAAAMGLALEVCQLAGIELRGEDTP